VKKRTYFATYWGAGWPTVTWLEPYFLTASGRSQFFEGGNDSWGFHAEGVDGTEHQEANKGRIDIHLEMWGNPDLGVLIIHSKRGGGHKETYTSKGDMSRLGELVRGMHGTPLPVGLFIPFEIAWKAVKEFIETDGALPTSIEWIANRDLPENTFPDP
jgi:Immunity protein Imm1